MLFGEGMRGHLKQYVAPPMSVSGQAKERLFSSRDTDLPQLHELFDFFFKQDALLSIVFTDEILDGETREKKTLTHTSKQIFMI